jgi:hypothetical protein
MNVKNFFAIVAVLAIGLPTVSFAHPGRTAADGYHYCRTNCDTWGVPWNERHTHGGYTAPKVSKPVSIDPCSHTGLLNTYKIKKAAGEKMESLATKSWWNKCPSAIRKSVFQALSK